MQNILNKYKIYGRKKGKKKIKSLYNNLYKNYLFDLNTNLKNKKFIISADYNGVICASFLSHILDWELVGYYDLESLWVSEENTKNYNDIIWVDLNILPKQGRAIGGHIVSLDGQTPKGFQTSCIPIYY